MLEIDQSNLLSTEVERLHFYKYYAELDSNKIGVIMDSGPGPMGWR